MNNKIENMTTDFSNKLKEHNDFMCSLNQTDLDEEDQNDSPKSFSCKYPGCGKSFRYRSEVIRHIVAHTGDRPFVCPDQNCGKGFKRADALATHIRIHTGEKPFKCSVGSCQLTFSTKAGLRYHLLKHKNEKVFKCDYPGCDQSFLTLPQLKQHKRGAKVHDASLSPKIHSPEQKHNRGSACEDMDLCDTNTSRQSTWNKYEPTVHKRVQIEEFKPSRLVPSQKVQQISIIGVNLQTIHTEKLEPRSLPLTSLLPIETQNDLGLDMEFLSSICAIDTAQKLKPSIQKESKENYNESALSKNTLENRTKLLKTINQALDENTALKKNLEFCQKIIRSYQKNLGARNINQLAACNPFHCINE